MCTDDGSDPHDVAAAAPRPATGDAVDPIALLPVDELTITVLTDNSFDALAADTPYATRARLGSGGTLPGPQYVDGAAVPGLVAEHGFAAVVLSHGHADHTGGFPGLRRWLARTPMPLVLHPVAWTRRRLVPAGGAPFVMPQLSRRALEGDGFSVVERREPSVLLDGCVLVTGEVDRTTEFERGMPAHEAEIDGTWRPDPWIVDDQALVVHVRDRGLVVLTGCGHAGAVNIVRHALRLTGVPRLHALVGGLHLTGPGFGPVVEPTVAALRDLAPDLVVPGHCSGWQAQMRLATELPDAFVPSAVGTRPHCAA